jgi:hypothetical protein
MVQLQLAGIATAPTPAAAPALDAAADTTSEDSCTGSVAAAEQGSGAASNRSRQCADTADDAIAQLDAALAELSKASTGTALLVHGDEIVSASEFCELEGEREVFEELTDEESVCTVQSNNVDIADSDEDEHDDHVPTTTKVTDALLWAQQLQDYAFTKPEYFSPESVQALRTIHDNLQQGRLDVQTATAISS